jgi:xanthine dehydrogenase small subunit
VDLGAFFSGYRQTTLGSVEILTAIEIDEPLPQELRFYKIAKRRLDDISTVAAAIALDRDASNRVTRARFCFGGVAATPVRLTETGGVASRRGTRRRSSGCNTRSTVRSHR